MKGISHIALPVALGIACAASGQDAHPDLSGQYDGASDFFGSARVCRTWQSGAENDCVEAPYTDRGAAGASAFSREEYQLAYGANCTVPRMPDVTWPGRYLLRIRQHEDWVELFYQRTDTIRTIRMTPEPAPADHPQTRLGYSVGHWDGDVLVIETTHMLVGNVGQTGHPYSEQAHVSERYWKEPDDEALNIEVTLEDPVNYTRPFVLYRYRFESQPDWEWTPWNCSIL